MNDTDNLITIEQMDEIALICINNPPVNATSPGVRQGLQDAIGNLSGDGHTKVGDLAGLDIVDRYTTTMIVEAARVAEDKTALRPVDMAFLFGYGFPRFRGGPLHFADTIGARELACRIETNASEDDHFWQAPGLLRKMAEDGSKLADLK